MKVKKCYKNFFIIYFMVLTTLTDLTLDISIWSIKKIYNISYWLLYGQQKSKEEILLENIIEKQDRYNKETLYDLIEEQKKNIEILNINVAKLTEQINKISNDLQ